MSQDSQGSINSLELMSQETHDVLQALLNSDGKGPNIEPAEYVHVLVMYFNTISFSVRGSSLRFSLHALASSTVDATVTIFATLSSNVHFCEGRKTNN